MKLKYRATPPYLLPCYTPLLCCTPNRATSTMLHLLLLPCYTPLPCLPPLTRYHVALAQKQIRLDLNERVKATVQTHARLQKASLTPDAGSGEAMTLLVTQQPEGTATFRKKLSKKEVRRALGS